MDSGPTVMIFDLKGTLLIEHPWPKPGTKYVSDGRRPGPAPRTTCAPRRRLAARAHTLPTIE